MLSAPQNLSPDNDLAANLAAAAATHCGGCGRAGRDVDSITLLAVSKGQAVDRLRQALALGLTQFGENYAA